MDKTSNNNVVLATVDVTDQQGHKQHLDLLQALTVETKIVKY